MMRVVVFAVVLVAGVGFLQAAPFSEGRAGFTVKVRGEANPYRVLGVFLMPLEKLSIEVVSPAPGSAFQLDASAGEVSGAGNARWDWKAPPAAGLYPLQVRREEPAAEMTLNVFVMVVATRVTDGVLNGYRIGDYPAKPLRDLDIYLAPRGFVEVTRENESTFLSPHFTLRQFLCKQEGGYPKFVVLRERLLLKLEYLLRAVNEKSIRTDGFHVMSGYRTPFYNAAIGNVKYSRHQWGDAADIFVDDNPRDGKMDDLNGDGRVDREDAYLLYDLVEAQFDERPYERFRGGLGAYGTTASHGPFVHVDARGFRARWGR